nr:tetratricopeptide repeat protein [Solimonas terrae]
MARLLGNLGRLQEAETHAEQVIEVERRLVSRDTQDVDRRQSLANNLCMAANLSRLRGEFGSAEHLSSECGRIAQDVSRRDPANVAAKEQVSLFLSLQYELRVQRGDFVAARQLLDQSVALQEVLSTADPSRQAWRARYSDVLADAAEHALRFDHKRARASSLAHAALALWQDRETTADARWYLLRSQLLLWEIAQADGDAVAAAAARDSATELLRQQRPSHYPRQLELRARYDYLDGTADAGDVIWQDLSHMGFRSRTFTMARETACARIERAHRGPYCQAS